VQLVQSGWASATTLEKEPGGGATGLDVKDLGGARDMPIRKVGTGTT